MVLLLFFPKGTFSTEDRSFPKFALVPRLARVRTENIMWTHVTVLEEEKSFGTALNFFIIPRNAKNIKERTALYEIFRCSQLCVVSV